MHVVSFQLPLLVIVPYCACNNPVHKIIMQKVRIYFIFKYFFDLFPTLRRSEYLSNTTKPAWWRVLSKNYFFFFVAFLAAFFAVFFAGAFLAVFAGAAFGLSAFAPLIVFVAASAADLFFFSR